MVSDKWARHSGEMHAPHSDSYVNRAGGRFPFDFPTLPSGEECRQREGDKNRTLS